MTEKASFLCSFDLHVIFVRYRRSDAGIMTEGTGNNSPKDERFTNNLDISK
jgi:hypothetical protein